MLLIIVKKTNYDKQSFQKEIKYYIKNNLSDKNSKRIEII